MQYWIMIRLLIFFLLTIFIVPTTKAGVLKGKVIDPGSGEGVVGASVEIKELHKEVLTGLDGSYVLKNIPEGKYTLTIHAVSYQPVSEPIEIGSGQTNLVENVTMKVARKDLQEVRIDVGRNMGTSDGGARKLEKVSDNIMNVLSEHQIRLMPDLTVANVLRRVSGVTVDRGYDGEGRFPVIRGMDKRYNYTLINGIKIPSPDDKNRYVPMDIFPSDILERLEVIKSLTPDMEGDAIGGVMNLVLKDAPDVKMVNVHGSLGYSQMLFDHPFTSFDHGAVNQKSPGEIYGANTIPTYNQFSTGNLVFTTGHPLPDGQLGFSLGNRFFNRRLGVILSGSFQSADRMSKDQFFELSPQPDPIVNGSNPEITDEENRTYSIHEDRLAAHAKVDYRLDDHNHISLYGMAMQLNAYESRMITDSSETQRLAPGQGVVQYMSRSKTTLQSIYNATLQGQHTLAGNHLFINWSGVYSYAGQKVPDKAELTLSQVFAPDPSGKVGPSSQPILAGLDRIWQHNEDHTYAGYLNLHYKFQTGLQKWELGVGAMYRHTERHNYYNEYDFDYPNNTVFTNIQDAPFYMANAGTPGSPNAYDATENISAGYGELRWIPSRRWNILAGVRFENTNQQYNQYEESINVPAKEGTVTYMDPLPSAQIKYALTDKQALHLTYFSAITRPGYFEIVPYSFVGEYYTENGNYNLKHVKAQNVDLRYEYFPGGADQLLVGAFFKKIENPIEYVYERPATSESVIEPSNLGTATNFGGEVVYTHYFHKFGISANYTYTHSNIPSVYKYYYTSAYGNDTTRLLTKNRPMQGQAAHVGNLSLLFKDPHTGIELQLSTIYTGRHIVYLSQYGTPNASMDYWQRGTLIEDFSSEKSIGRHFALYVKLNNLLNTPDIIEMRFPPTAQQKALWPDATQRSDRTLVEKKYFGQSYLIGLRYHL